MSKTTTATLGQVTDEMRAELARDQELVASVTPGALAERAVEMAHATAGHVPQALGEVGFSPSALRALEEAESALRQRACVVGAAPDAPPRLRVVACEVAEAWRSCVFVNDHEQCPRPGYVAAGARAEARMRSAGVPELLLEEVMARYARVLPSGSVQHPGELRDTEALRIALAVSTRKPQNVYLDSGAVLTLLGHETILLLSAATGRGKSLGAAAFLAERGGLWVDAKSFERPNDLEERCAAATNLVIDDAGEEDAGPRDYAPGRIAAVVCARQARRQLTVLTSNIATVEGFFERFGDRVRSRMRQSGVFAIVGGPDLRKAE